jgi:hypothetical protein
MTNDQFILACDASEREECRALGCTLAHFGYRISVSGRLLRVSPGPAARGGILVLSDDGTGVPDPPVFLRMLEGELVRQGFGGIFADFDAFSPKLSALIESMDALAARRGIALYVPELYAPQAPGACILTGSDVVAGSYRLRLEEQRQRYERRTALELVPVREDFALPSSGQGRRMREGELDALLARGMTPYYSDELCLHYFTYVDREHVTHFVVYDDAQSLRRKTQIAQDLGIEKIFALYAELRTLAPDILFPGEAY